MTNVRHAVNWIEIPVTDLDRAATFYGRIFDYEPHRMPMGPTQMAMLPFSDPESVGGALVLGDGYVPTRDGAKVYLNGGDDLQPVLDRVADAGGSVVMPKTLIDEEIGYMAAFDDTEGNRVYLHSRP